MAIPASELVRVQPRVLAGTGQDLVQRAVPDRERACSGRNASDFPRRRQRLGVLRLRF